MLGRPQVRSNGEGRSLGYCLGMTGQQGPTISDPVLETPQIWASNIVTKVTVGV